MGKSIDRQTAKEIQRKVRDFVDSLEAEYGIKTTKNSATFTEADIKLTITATISKCHSGGQLTH